MLTKAVMTTVLFYFLLMPAQAGEAAVIWSDTFEGPAVGQVPDPLNWTVTIIQNGSATISNEVVPPQGTKELKLVTTGSMDADPTLAGNVTLTSNTNWQKSSVWLDFYTYFDDASSADMLLLSVGPMKDTSTLACALRCEKLNYIDTTYQATVMHTALKKEDVIATGLSFQTWDHWVFGVTITDSVTGDGKYWVYQNGSLLTDVNGVSFSSYSGNANIINGVHIFNYDYDGSNGSTTARIDNFKVYNRNPVATKCGDPGTLYLPGDLNRDCFVDFKDVRILVQLWLACTDPAVSSCSSN